MLQQPLFHAWKKQTEISVSFCILFGISLQQFRRRYEGITVWYRKVQNAETQGDQILSIGRRYDKINGIRKKHFLGK